MMGIRAEHEVLIGNIVVGIRKSPPANRAWITRIQATVHFQIRKRNPMHWRMQMS